MEHAANFAHSRQTGVTLVELIMGMIIMGVLAAIAVPRLMDTSVFQSSGFANQLQSALRYAQKQAIARHSLVCVALTTNSIKLTTDATCSTNLNFPEGGNALNAPSGVTLSPAPTNFNFDALGSTAAQQVITVSGAPNSIIVEAETGYVHSP